MPLAPDEPHKPLTADTAEEWLWRVQKEDTTQRYLFNKVTFSLLKETSTRVCQIGTETRAESKSVKVQARTLRSLSEQLRQH